MSDAVEAWAQLGDLLARVVEVAAGHREKARSAGFSDTAAEAMGVDAHRYVITYMTTMFAQTAKSEDDRRR